MSELIDNRAARIRTLKEVIRGLHRGEAKDAVRQRLKELVRQCDAGEIAAMEQQLIAEGVPVQEIMGMCDLHSQVVRELLVERPGPTIATGHPVDVFRRENAALGERVAALRELLRGLVGAESPDASVVERARALYHELMDVDTHYARKENLLFPMLERHGIVGPSKVMWGKDDEARELLRGLGRVLDRDERDAAARAEVVKAGEPALDALDEMIQKEEKILLPLALQTLTEAEWGEIWSQSPEFGWCLVDPAGEYRPPAAAGPEIHPETESEARRAGVALQMVSDRPRSSRPPSGAIVFPTGSLQPDQLRAIFCTLPVDVTFVDADDRVRFFSEGPERIFMRPKAVIGRRVQHCHPPSSVEVVERILRDFKSGEQDVAEFWIRLRGRFVHIRYFALRDEQQRYLGTLEVTQDITALRELEGERRLLQYA